MASMSVFCLIGRRLVIIGTWLQTWRFVIVDVDVCIIFSLEMERLYGMAYTRPRSPAVVTSTEK
jgi:hypothetical protein